MSYGNFFNLLHFSEMELISELNQGKELAQQLMNNLNPSSPIETRQFLVDKIVSCYERALSMLNWSDFGVEPEITVIPLESSPLSDGTSCPRRDVIDKECKDGSQLQKNASEKRKRQHRWTQQVRIRSGVGEEGSQLDDGHNWRKYGQKTILGATYPRGYYRCTHRDSQGCLAIKQVQRTDDDPSIFQVTYRGRHTCVQASNRSGINRKSVKSKEHCQQQQPKKKQKPSGEEFDNKEEIFPSFSFPSEPIGNENEDNIFIHSTLENNFLSVLSTTFISPASSESNYFSMSPCHINKFGIGCDVQTPESDHSDIISAPTSVTNSQIGDLDICNMLDFDAFDSSEIFALVCPN